jgi:hypothetical protein
VVKGRWRKKEKAYAEGTESAEFTEQRGRKEGREERL